MADFFKNKNFNTSYKRRPRDEYKAMIDKLPEETKRKLDRQRTLIMTAVVVFVVGLILVLAATGIGVDKDGTITGNMFEGRDELTIACFGDSITEGYVLNDDGSSYICETAYPDSMKEEISKNYELTLNVENYGISGDVGENTSYRRVDEEADVCVVLYMVNNFIDGLEYEGILEANVSGLKKQGAVVFLVNYPVCEGSEYEELVEEANDYIEDVSASEEVTMIDAADYFQNRISSGTYTAEELFCSDGLHLTEEGYSLLGKIVAEGLMNTSIE